MGWAWGIQLEGLLLLAVGGIWWRTSQEGFLQEETPAEPGRLQESQAGQEVGRVFLS